MRATTSILLHCGSLRVTCRMTGAGGFAIAERSPSSVKQRAVHDEPPLAYESPWSLALRIAPVASPLVYRIAAKLAPTRRDACREACEKAPLPTSYGTAERGATETARRKVTSGSASDDDGSVHGGMEATMVGVGSGLRERE